MRRGAAGLLGALALAAACGRARAPAAAPDDELTVEAGRVERGEAKVVAVGEEELPQRVAAAGRVTFDDQRVQHLVSPVAGQVTRLLAEPGQRVRKGAPLLALVSPEVGGALSDVVKAEADLGQAAAELARQQRLVALEAAPRRDLEAAQDAHRKAQAELARARQRATLLRRGDVDAVTQELTLRSALDGVVMARAVGPGAQVQGAYSGGTPVELFTVGDIDRVWVVGDLAEEDLSRVRLGAGAEVRVAAWPGRVFRGAVGWVASALDPALRTGRVRVTLDNPDHALKPEMYAQLSLEAPPRRGLVVPRRALQQLEGESFAWVAEGADGGGRLRFRRRRVQVSGDPAAPLAVVAGGLAPGERVLVDEGTGVETAGDEVRLSRGQVEKAGIRVEPARALDLGDALTAGARLAFADDRVAHVFSPVTGRVVKVLAEPGQHVRRGAPLLSLLSPEVGSAFADALKAEADQVAAEHEARRQRELVAARAGARKDLEAAEASLRKARAELDRARQKTRLLAGGDWDAVSQQYTLRSPIEGEVVTRAAAPGVEVQGQWSGAGAPVELFTIGALDPLWVMGEVYEMDLPHVRPGLEVTAQVPAFPGRTFRGRVAWVSDVLDPATRTARVRCALDNRERLLRPEMAPVLSIALPSLHRLAVPRPAVLRLNEGTFVFVAAAGAPADQPAFRKRRVVVGEEGPGGAIPVLEGLASGEQVVTSGAIFLSGML